GLYVGLLLGAVFAGFPVVWMFFSSFKSNTEIFALPPKLFPDNFILDAYKTIFASEAKIRFFLNSYFIAIAVTLMTLVFAILAAYSFSRYSFAGKRQLNLFIISTQSLPPITLLIPYFGLIASLKLYDTYFALIFTYMVFTLPYAILMMTGYFNTLPKE
ncbi:MAG: carbohydrate ABC transporter permease, partial [Clostridia bacterium]